MKITLMNYDGKKASVDIGNKEDIANIFIVIVSGDEVAHITYKDYSHKSYDSAEMTGSWRTMDFDDGGYLLYNFKEKENLIDNPKWINRESSYYGQQTKQDGKVR